jgi:Ca-activated chloride channel family protein
MRIPSSLLIVVALTGWVMAAPGAGRAQTVFKGGVDIVNVTATVTDDDGRFVTGLTKDDFIVYDNGVAQEIVNFSSERVPVSLGILLDVSGSMTDEKMAAARAAMNRFAFDLLGEEDELFLAEFAGGARMLQTWTEDRAMFSRAIDRAQRGRQRFGTAVYDAVAATVMEAAGGLHTKKAVLIISDGQDNSSVTPVERIHELIQISEVLVYALGVEERGGGRFGGVDARRLRRLTDESGGRTEIVRGFQNLDTATARLADELNQQYVIGYAAPPQRDGRWHAITLEVKERDVTVRARTGYIAS